eukprot:TRINITY_DN9013_c0_g1_i3.p1 TRINITY_DN9013_c0_g1~~TRINITY_DN9013_c0_g1_i3.p1  ORF type:complete len:122 (-),score=13.82 TRINITY_DN9013_c0_g1_i3:25-390(-)
MDEMRGSLGTSSSLSLRLGQALFSLASLLFMSVGVQFYSYSAFCYLVTIMGLVIPWSLTLAMVDVYSIVIGCPFRHLGHCDCGCRRLGFINALTGCSLRLAGVIDLLMDIGRTYTAPKFCT